jgi:dTMP kinase
MFIVFEGIDGSGKDTQLELLKKTLKFRHFKYPTQKFSQLRDHLDGKIKLERKGLFLAFLADQANEQEEVAKSELAIADRYVFSTVAYEKGAYTLAEAKKIVIDISLLKPDLVILLDISPEAAQKRKAAQKKLDAYESDLAHLREVRERFLQLAKENFYAKRWVVINADEPVEKVQEHVKAEVSKTL